MSWKRVDEAAALMRWPSWSRDSLAGRLSLYFGAGSLLIIGCLGAVLFIVFERSLHARDSSELASKTLAVQELLSGIEQTEQLNESLGRIRATRIGHEDLDIGVLIDGVWLIRPEQALIDHVEQHDGFPGHGIGGQMPFVSKGRSWTMSHLSHHPEGPPDTVFEAVVAIDVTDTTQLITSLRNTVIAIGLLGAAMIAALTWWAVSRALAPLKRIATAAENMTAQALDQPLSVENAPVEIRGMVNSLNQMLSGLRRSFASLEQFSADIAHELRTPVNAMLTQTQVMLSRERSIDEYRETLHQGLEELNRLQRMVSDMLFIARADRSINSAPPELVDITASASDVVEYLELVASDKGQRIVLNGRLVAPGEALMLRRAITNLVDNAVRYAPPNTTIELTLSVQDDEAVVEVRNPCDHNMSAADTERLFDRFTRHADSADRQQTGLGLGLSIVQSIMRVHGGRASATASAGMFVAQLRWPAAR